MDDYLEITYMNHTKKSVFQYFKRDSTGEVAKLAPEGIVFILQVVGYTDGSFVHRRSKTVYTEEQWPAVLETFKQWQPATYKDYMLKLRDYYQMDGYYRPTARMAWDNFRISSVELGFEHQ